MRVSGRLHPGYTMDVESKRTIFERGGQGQAYEGEVTSSRGEGITLLMRFGNQPRQVTWSAGSQTITIEGVEGDPERPRTTMRCEQIAPRTMIELQDAEARLAAPRRSPRLTPPTSMRSRFVSSRIEGRRDRHGRWGGMRWTRLSCALLVAHEAAGAARRPAFPGPSMSEGGQKASPGRD